MGSYHCSLPYSDGDPSPDTGSRQIKKTSFDVKIFPVYPLSQQKNRENLIML